MRDELLNGSSLICFMEKEIAEASWKERILFFIGRRKGILVEGNSMLPTLKNGDTVLIDPKAEILFVPPAEIMVTALWRGGKVLAAPGADNCHRGSLCA